MKQVKTENLPAVKETLENYAISTVEENISEILEENLGVGGLKFGDLASIKVPSGGNTAWTVADDEGNEDSIKEISGIIVFDKSVRQYYSAAYTGDKTPPDCMSSDCITGFGNPGGKCATCEHAQYGTAKNASGQYTDGQACGERRLIFFITEDSVLPQYISVPPTSLLQARKYLISLASKRPFCKKFEIVTKFTLRKGKNKKGIEYSEVVFTKGEMLDDNAKLKMREYVEKIKPILDGKAAEIAQEDRAAA